MDKLLKIICNQQKYLELDCNNCGKKNKFKTTDLFKANTYNTTCPKCKAELSYDTTKLANDLKKAFKSLNIKY